MFYYGFDMYYLILVMPALIFAMWAQFNVTSTFKKYSRVSSERGMTGRDAARLILDRHGLTNVEVVETRGNLTDHYDPKANVIRLSETTYNVQSAAAVGVAAHEAGHAVQYAEGYSPIKLRQAIIPVSRIGSSLAIPLVLLGIIFSYMPIAYAGIILFGAAVLFQLVTLPVEFNASRRALATIDETGVLSGDGLHAASRVLRAAALTYVAALFVSLANMLRLLALVSNRRDR
ncbi:MAG: zinc metallopeptidase [Clostridiales bacterium]|nr:zinc metallopeptidase [Clostridiales bacterium]